MNAGEINEDDPRENQAQFVTELWDQLTYFFGIMLDSSWFSRKSPWDRMCLRYIMSLKDLCETVTEDG